MVPRLPQQGVARQSPPENILFEGGFVRVRPLHEDLFNARRAAARLLPVALESSRVNRNADARLQRVGVLAGGAAHAPVVQQLILFKSILISFNFSHIFLVPMRPLPSVPQVLHELRG